MEITRKQQQRQPCLTLYYAHFIMRTLCGLRKATRSSVPYAACRAHGRRSGAHPSDLTRDARTPAHLEVEAWQVRGHAGGEGGHAANVCRTRVAPHDHHFVPYLCSTTVTRARAPTTAGVRGEKGGGEGGGGMVLGGGAGVPRTGGRPHVCARGRAGALRAKACARGRREAEQEMLHTTQDR